MFTGIISDIGEVIAREEQASGLRLRIRCAYPAASLTQGESIACNGVCLTVTDKGEAASTTWFSADVSLETLSCTVPDAWKKGAKLNLERALTAGDALGGHIVTGHVDGLAGLAVDAPEGECRRWRLEAPEALAPYIAAKGSVTLDGVSLTVNTVEANAFTVNLIPHTLAHTTLGTRKTGDRLNLEIDILSRYVRRHLEAEGKL